LVGDDVGLLDLELLERASLLDRANLSDGSERAERWVSARDGERTGRAEQCGWLGSGRVAAKKKAARAVVALT